MGSLQNQAGWYAKLQLTVAGLMVLLAVGFYAGGYRRLGSRLEALQMQIEAKQRQLQADQSRARQLADVAVRVDKLRLLLDRFDKKLPKRDDLSQFIREITQLSQQTSLRKGLSVQKGLQRRADGLCELPILLNFEGDFLSVAAFLRQAEQMQRLTRIRKLDIRQTDAKLGTVEVQMAINIYYTEG